MKYWSKKAVVAVAFMALSAATVQAQDKKELATRIVNLQKGQDMNALIVQLTGSANKVVVDT